MSPVNERVPDSAGLPLRAMVMVLLFLGLIFLLVGFQAMTSDGAGAAARTHGLETDEQEDHSEKEQHHDHGAQGQPGRIGDALVHRAHCIRPGAAVRLRGTRSPAAGPRGPFAGWLGAVAAV